MNNNKDGIKRDLTQHRTRLILKDSFENEPLVFQQKFINIRQKYISEVESLLKYFYKIERTNNNSNIVSIIFSNFNCAIAFYYYQDSLFDVSILLTDKLYLQGNIIRKEEFISLEAPLNSSILSKTLEEGSQIKQLIFLNHDYTKYNIVFHISFSANTLTIDWSEIKYKEVHLEYLKNLIELWPGLILSLKNLELKTFEQLDWIQNLLIYYEGSLLCWKLSFSKVLINIVIDINEIRSIEYFKDLNKLKNLCDSLSLIYDVQLENITYEDLFFKLF